MESGCDVSFNGMLADHKEVCIKRRSTLHVVDPVEEEQEYDHVAEEYDKIEEKE